MRSASCAKLFEDPNFKIVLLNVFSLGAKGSENFDCYFKLRMKNLNVFMPGSRRKYLLRFFKL